MAILFLGFLLLKESELIASLTNKHNQLLLNPDSMARMPGSVMACEPDDLECPKLDNKLHC